MAVLELEEAADSLAPSVDVVSAEDGSCTRVWRSLKSFTVSDPQDVIDTENYFVGGTATGGSPARPGVLARTLPAPDPQHIGWWCRKVNGVRGIADRNKVPDGYTIDLSQKDRLLALGVVPLGKTILPGYALYPMYEFNVTSGPRPYPVVGDDKISLYTSKPDGSLLTFYWPDGQTQSHYAYADEWKRFTSTPKYSPQNDYVTAQQGSLVFRTTDAVPNGFVFTGMPRVFLRTDVVTVEWFGVPLRYITSPRSFVRRFRGLVNQYAWYGGPGQETFGPGSLLYLTYDYTDYCPPLNSYEVIFPGSGGGTVPDVLGLPRLVNLKFTFLHTDRKATNPIAPTWPGWVPHGHNALPWLQRPNSFYYATAQGVPLALGGGPGATIPATWYPMFNSFPVELLFTDPDGSQPGDFPLPGQGGI